MSKQERIELIQEWVEKNHITNLKELEQECKKYGLDWYDDICSGIEYNCCDRCGELYPSERLYWEDYDFCKDDNPELYFGIENEGKEYCSLCSECVKTLIEKGEERKKYLLEKEKVAGLDDVERYELCELLN